MYIWLTESGETLCKNNKHILLQYSRNGAPYLETDSFELAPLPSLITENILKVTLLKEGKSGDLMKEGKYEQEGAVAIVRSHFPLKSHLRPWQSYSITASTPDLALKILRSLRLGELQPVEVWKY